jgi:hypothetical protein
VADERRKDGRFQRQTGQFIRSQRFERQSAPNVQRIFGEPRISAERGRL